MESIFTVFALLILSVGIYVGQKKITFSKDQRIKEVLSTKSQESAQPPYQSSENIEELVYPNSEVVNKDSNTLNLRSFDDAKVITDWYKNVIKGKGFNMTTYVSTKANEKILNKLVGTGAKEKISVEIKRDDTQYIEINVSTSN